MNQRELSSISAVVAYVAHQQKVDEAAVCAMLAAAFGVADVRDLTSDDYDGAIRFLVDLHLDEVAH